jgi:signal peptidase I
MKKIYFLLLLLVSGTFFYTLRLYKLEGTSMNYGLTDGDYVVASSLFSTIERGDLLVMKHPLDPEDRRYIKRCTALPGDKFFQKARAFYLQPNGDSAYTKKLAETHDLHAVRTEAGYFLKDPYGKYYGIVHNWNLQVPDVLTRLPLTTVPHAHYMLMGDYRDNSADSRFFGAVPERWICSKILYIFKKSKSWETLINIEEADEKNASERKIRHTAG